MLNIFSANNKIDFRKNADTGELTDDELYPSDAAWSGLYDRMLVHLPDETERRLELAAARGDCNETIQPEFEGQI